MAILNEQFEWSHFETNAGLRMAFRGAPEKTLFHSGRLLCRFITCELAQSGIRGNEVFRSPWWSEWRETSQLLHRFKSRPIASREIIRAKLAITHEFSATLDGLVQIKLTEPVYGWVGPARYQNDKQSKVTYIGGATQIFLPNLAGKGNAMSSPVAYLQSFSFTDNLD